MGYFRALGLRRVFVYALVIKKENKQTSKPIMAAYRTYFSSLLNLIENPDKFQTKTTQHLSCH